MKKFLLALSFIAIFAAPAFAFSHKVHHPKPMHATNPYLKHPAHKAQRHRHKKI
jgi:hypothetical protein